MRVDLDLSTSEGGVLMGTASWGGGEPTPFHGTLELIALLMAAGDLRVSDSRPVRDC